MNNFLQNSVSSSILVPLKYFSCKDVSNGLSLFIFRKDSNMVMSSVLPNRLGLVNRRTVAESVNTVFIYSVLSTK